MTPSIDIYSLDVPYISQWDRKPGHKPKYNTPEEALEAKIKSTKDHHQLHHVGIP